MKKTRTAIQQGHLIVTQAKQEELLHGGVRGWFWWNWRVGVVGYGFKIYIWLVGRLTGYLGYYLFWDLIGSLNQLLRDKEKGGS